MITAIFKGPEGQHFNIGWMDEGTELRLDAVPEGINVRFCSEPNGQEIELQFHPSMIKMLANWIDAQPKYTFMAKEGRPEMIAEMEAFDKEWAEKQRRAKATGAIEPPF
jgi:hypothetical protein